MSAGGAYAIRDVLKELAAGVEDGPLAVGVVEATIVAGHHQLEDLRTEIPV